MLLHNHFTILSILDSMRLNLYKPVKLSALILLLFCLTSLAAQTRTIGKRTPSSQVEAIESYCKEIDSFIKRNPKRERLFANVAPGTENVPDQWRELKGENERTGADTSENLNDNAYVWVRNGKVVGADFTFQSPSRDWVQYAMYYFREDGTLAKTQATFNTFYGNMQIIRKGIYNAKGKLLRSWAEYFDLRTGQKRKRSRVAEEAAPVYKKVRNLPFYELL